MSYMKSYGFEDDIDAEIARLDEDEMADEEREIDAPGGDDEGPVDEDDEAPLDPVLIRRLDRNARRDRLGAC